MKHMEDKHTPVEWFAHQLGITSGSLLEKALDIERDHLLEMFSKSQDSKGYIKMDHQTFKTLIETYYDNTRRTTRNT